MRIEKQEMDTVPERPFSHRYSAHNSVRAVNLYFNAPKAKSVEVEGSFTEWSPVAMRRQVDGWWQVQLMACHGHHQYRFLVDGAPILDPKAAGVGRDEQNQPISLMAVSLTPRGFPKQN